MEILGYNKALDRAVASLRYVTQTLKSQLLKHESA